MGEVVRRIGGLAAVTLAGMALSTRLPSAAQAEPATATATATGTAIATATGTAGRRVVGVPCSAAALSTAINAANAVPATLRLAPRCVYQITGTLSVSGTVALVGGPSTAIRPATGFTGRLLDVTVTGRLRVEGIFILNGVGNNGDSGVGIRNAGRLVLNFVTVSGNTATNGNGAGLANLQGATALIAHSIVSANNANGTNAGSGIGGGLQNAGILTLFKSRVTANTAERTGGGVSTEATGTTRIVQSTIDHNFTPGSGGGIANSGVTSLDRTLVERNRAGTSGGGIFKSGGTVTVRLSIIRANTPDNCAPAGSVPGCTG